MHCKICMHISISLFQCYAFHCSHFEINAQQKDVIKWVHDSDPYSFYDDLYRWTNTSTTIETMSKSNMYQRFTNFVYLFNFVNKTYILNFLRTMRLICIASMIGFCKYCLFQRFVKTNIVTFEPYLFFRSHSIRIRSLQYYVIILEKLT